MIAACGASSPAWRRDGRELFFLDGPVRDHNSKLEVVDVRPGANIEVGTPHELFSTYRLRGFDVMPDGQQFVIAGSDQRSL